MPHALVLTVRMGASRLTGRARQTRRDRRVVYGGDSSHSMERDEEGTMVGVAKGSFAEVSNKPDFPAQERATLRRWADEGTVGRYLRRNDAATP